MPEKDWNVEANIEAGQRKNLKETSLIAEFEMEYGSEDTWSDEIKEDFEKKWDEIEKGT